MKTSVPSQPAIGHPTRVGDQRVYTLTGLLPLPLDGLPEALRT